MRKTEDIMQELRMWFQGYSTNDAMTCEDIAYDALHTTSNSPSTRQLTFDLLPFQPQQ